MSFLEEPMRPPQSTLTPNHVHLHAAALLQTHLKLHDHGPKGHAGLLLTLLFAADARINSLSDACKRLRDAPSVEAARLALLAALPDFAETQPRLNRALAGHLPKALLKSRNSVPTADSGVGTAGNGRCMRSGA
jgi:hypothetical protein